MDSGNWLELENMPTVRWETRASSPHYYFCSLERFHMVQMLRDLELILMFFVLEMSDDSSSGVTLPLLTMMTMFSVEDDLRRIRPSNFYPPADFILVAQTTLSGMITAIIFSRSSGSGFLISVEWSRLCSGKARLSLVVQAQTRFVLITASWFFFAAWLSWLIHADSLIWSKILGSWCPQTGSAKYFTQYWQPWARAHTGRSLLHFSIFSLSATDKKGFQNTGR